MAARLLPQLFSHCEHAKRLSPLQRRTTIIPLVTSVATAFANGSGQRRLRHLSATPARLPPRLRTFSSSLPFSISCNLTLVCGLLARRLPALPGFVAFGLGDWRWRLVRLTRGAWMPADRRNTTGDRVLQPDVRHAGWILDDGGFVPCIAGRSSRHYRAWLLLPAAARRVLPPGHVPFTAAYPRHHRYMPPCPSLPRFLRSFSQSFRLPPARLGRFRCGTVKAGSLLPPHLPTRADTRNHITTSSLWYGSLSVRFVGAISVLFTQHTFSAPPPPHCYRRCRHGSVACSWNVAGRCRVLLPHGIPTRATAHSRLVLHYAILLPLPPVVTRGLRVDICGRRWRCGVAGLKAALRGSVDFVGENAAAERLPVLFVAFVCGDRVCMRRGLCSSFYLCRTNVLL